MPYTGSQNKLFRAAAHDPDIAEKHNLSQSKAEELANEGIKKDSQVTPRKRTIRVRFKSLMK